jgi:hypothetical protein
VSANTDTFLSCRVPPELKQQIYEFRTKYHLKSMSDATIKLLGIGLFVEAKKEELGDPEIVQFLQERLYDQQLVDWIFELPADRLEALYGTFRSARDLRYGHANNR